MYYKHAIICLRIALQPANNGVFYTLKIIINDQG